MVYSDMAAAFVGHHTDFQWLVQKLQINTTHLEPYQHNSTRVDDFNTQLTRQLDDTNFVLPGNDIDYYPEDQHQEDTENGDPDDGDAGDDTQPEADTINDYDKLVGATFLLDPIRNPGNVATKATVTKRKTDMHGKLLGKAHPNPSLLDTQE